jgi:hypothetical protein
MSRTLKLYPDRPQHFACTHDCQSNMVDRAIESVVPPGMNSVENENNAPDEESPLLSRSPQSETAKPKVKALAGVGTIIAVLLLGKISARQNAPEI